MPQTADGSTRVRQRSRARAVALQALCVFDAVGDGFLEKLPAFLRDESVLADLDIDAPPAEELVQFAYRLATRAWSDRRKLDEQLQRIAARWTISRMPPVDRNIMRMVLCELRDADPDRPPQTLISEATDLAAAFGDTDSPAFVNGVLDAAWRELEQGGSVSTPPGE